MTGSMVADAWGRRFLGHLAAGVASTGRGDGRGVARRTRVATRSMILERPTAGTGRQDRAIIGLCSIVLAAYREVLVDLGDSRAAVAVVREAFASTYRTPARFGLRSWLLLVGDPVKAMTKLPMARLCRWIYGPSMAFEKEVGVGHVDLIVRRCAYHQFFVEAGEPELTRVFCGWDRNWMDVIDASDRPIHTERPTTFSTGGDCCRFRFVRDDPRPAGPPLDIVTRP